MNQPGNDDPIRSSTLMQDLCSESRESIYRAMSYLHRSGAPAGPDGSNDIDSLRVLRQPLAAWLLSVPDPETIVDGYAEFIQRWSPVFRD